LRQFVISGWSHAKDPAFAMFLGVAELAGGLSVGFGVLTQLAAIGLILIMLGAIQKKIFVWQTGFLGRKGCGLDEFDGGTLEKGT